MNGGISLTAKDENRSSERAAVTFTCAICCDTIHEEEHDWVVAQISSEFSPAVQELFTHKRCLALVIGKCVPLGEVFE